MRPVRRFEVRPAIPDALADLPALASNLHWVWDRELVRLFERIWPGWTADEAHPAHMVRTTSSERMLTFAQDQGIVRDIAAAKGRLEAAISGPTWFGARSDESPLGTVAYFSPEFGLTEALPQYSGGLGVLAGDHLKASSDLGVPLVGVGLLYTEGYFHQELDANGWQQERTLNMDPESLGLADTGVRVTVDLAGDPVTARVWRADVGSVALYLLDTDLPDNSADGIAVTDRLYGGDSHHRLRQEIILGIGGVRALRALGIAPEVFHMNEGHAGFLGLERIREYVAAGLSFPAAVEAVRAGGVFTTHTPVPAGIDRFDRDLMERYFTSFAAECGVSFDELYTVGESPDDGGDIDQRKDGTNGGKKFNMAVMGLRLAARSNGVAQLHGSVSRAMFKSLWPDISAEEVPIKAITNGVHGRSWTSSRVDALLSRTIGDDWTMAGPERWAVVHDLDPAEVWDTMIAGRRGLVRFVRGLLGEGVLNPDTLTIGFARRFATYKRATLLLSQPERLMTMLNDADRPVQFVFAGKAHPADTPGKELIQQIEQFARKANVRHRFVFIADYDIAIAREMYHGCDVWLNTPRRPLEACGTSGMKAALNGSLNCSILDGWWDECYNPGLGGAQKNPGLGGAQKNPGLSGAQKNPGLSGAQKNPGLSGAQKNPGLGGAQKNTANGWAIQSAEDDPDLARRDERECANLFSVLEEQVIPTFYELSSGGVPKAWAEMVQQSWATLGPCVTAARMVRDYTTDLYEPAAAHARSLNADGAAAAAELARWRSHVRSSWSSVKITSLDVAADPGDTGTTREVLVTLDRDGLQPADIRVEVLHGTVGTDGEFMSRPTTVVLQPTAEGATYRGEIALEAPGSYGVAARVVPVHPGLASPYDLGLATWAT